jgi:hypothetical protein
MKAILELQGLPSAQPARGGISSLLSGVCCNHA